MKIVSAIIRSISNIYESPITYDDSLFEPSEAQLNKMFKKFKETNKKIFLENIYTNADLYRLGNKLFILDLDLNKLTYFVVLNTRIISGKTYTYQSPVWRYFGATDTKTVPQYVFFKYVLNELGRCVTDQEQTPDGRRFWRNAVAESIKNNYSVFWKDLNLKKHRVDIKNPNELTKYNDEIWGGEEKNRARLLFIEK